MSTPLKTSREAITIEHLDVQFDDTSVLQDVSLNVKQGEWLSIVGPSGCGKSTLLRVISRLTSASAGRMTALFRTPAFVFQDPTLMPWRTVQDNVRLAMELEGTPLKEQVTATRSAVEAVGLEESDLDKYPRQLSGGMRMRVSLARAMVTQPDLLLLDEPFAALDEILREQLNQLVHEIWRQRQMTTLFVTHNVTEAVYLGGRVIVMNSDGQLVNDRTIDLPNERVPSLKTTSGFIKQVVDVSECLQKVLS